MTTPAGDEPTILKCQFCGCFAPAPEYAAYIQQLVRCPHATRGEHVWQRRLLKAFQGGDDAIQADDGTYSLNPKLYVPFSLFKKLQEEKETHDEGSERETRGDAGGGVDDLQSHAAHHAPVEVAGDEDLRRVG